MAKQCSEDEVPTERVLTPMDRQSRQTVDFVPTSAEATINRGAGCDDDTIQQLLSDREHLQSAVLSMETRLQAAEQRMLAAEKENKVLKKQEETRRRLSFGVALGDDDEKDKLIEKVINDAEPEEADDLYDICPLSKFF